ncbi:hypothetical protein ACTXIV_13145 [Psychrobacter celer]|uniref:hypothetical protein n=1 Tax=Psychrobacter celer TaxID=306572 RepID=UPI003FD5E5E9
MTTRKIKTNPPVELNNRAWFFIELIKEYKPDLLAPTMAKIKADVQRVIYERGGVVGEYLNIVAQESTLDQLSSAIIDDATHKYAKSLDKVSDSDKLAFRDFFRKSMNWRLVSNSENMQFNIFGNLVMDLNDVTCAIETAINSEIPQNQTPHSA